MPKKNNTLDKWLSQKSAPNNQADLNGNAVQSGISASTDCIQHTKYHRKYANKDFFHEIKPNCSAN